MKRFLAVLLFVLLSISITVLAGCQQKSSDQSLSGKDTEPVTPVTTEPLPTATTVKKLMTVTLYFMQEQDGAMFLVPEKREIPKTESVAGASLEELIKGAQKPGLTSAIPSKTRVLSIKVANGLATVDFSKEVLDANIGSEAEALGIAQIVNTLTEYPSISKVKFLVEGKEEGEINGREVRDWWGHVGLYDQPFSRNTALIKGGKVSSDTIEIDSPRAFTPVKSPLTVKGKAQVFEAQFQVRILDKNGTTLADVPVMADDFDWGNFDKNINYKKPETPGRGTVHFYFFSAKDGSEITMADVPVFLE